MRTAKKLEPQIKIALTPFQVQRAGKIVFAVAEELKMRTEHSMRTGGLIAGNEQQMLGLREILRQLGKETDRAIFFILADQANTAYLRRTVGD